MTLAATLACASVTTEPDLARQHLVDTAAIQIDDLETPAERFEDLSQTGQMAEFVDDQAGYGFVVPSLGKGDAELVRHFVHGHPSRQKPGTVRAPHRLRLGLALVRPERSCNRVQNVGRGHYSLEVTIFVVNEGHRRLGFAQDVQDVEGVDRVGDNGRLPYMGADVDGFSVQEGSQEIAYLHHADQFVGAGFADRKPRMARGDQLLLYLGVGVVEIEPVDLGARRHERPRGPVAEAEHRRDHLLLVRLDHAGGLRFGDKRFDFLIGDRVLRLGRLPENPEYEPRGGVKQPHQRRCDPRDNGHRGRHPAGYGLSVSQREILWQKLPDDDRKIGDQADDDAVTHRIRNGERKSSGKENVFQALPQSGAGERSREDADKRYADLHRRQETAGVVGKGQGGRRAAPAVVR